MNVVWEYLGRADMVYPAAWASLVYALKASLVIVVALLTVRLMAHMSALARYLVLRLAVVAVLLMPAVALVVPGWSLGLTDSLTSLLPGEIVLLIPSTVDAGSTATTTRVSIAWPVVVILIWLIGVGLYGVRFAVGRVAVRKMVNRARQCGESDSRVEAIAKSMGIPSSVPVLVAPTAVPFASGFRHPVIVLPEDVAVWSNEKVRLVLCHEYTHIRRHDLIWQGLVGVVLALHWFNPLAYLLNRRVMIEAEKACDDAVLAAGVCPDTYAQCLIDIIRDIPRPGKMIPQGAGMARTTYLEGRFMSILNEHRRQTRMSRAALVWLTAIALLVVLPLAGWQVQAGDTVEAGVKYPKVHSGADNSLPGPDDFVSVDTYPEMMTSDRPEYPASAKEAGIEGVVWVMALVDSTGTVLEVRVKKSSGTPALDDSATKAAGRARFKPATADGKPVAVWVSFSYDFKLDGKK